MSRTITVLPLYAGGAVSPGQTARAITIAFSGPPGQDGADGQDGLDGQDGDTGPAGPNIVSGDTVADIGSGYLIADGGFVNSTAIIPAADIDPAIARDSEVTAALAALEASIATALALKANLASPALTGTPTAPTAAGGTNTTQIATTAFVLANAPPPSIGGTVTSGTANRVLYVGAGSVLADDAGLTYNPTTDVLSVTKKVVINGNGGSTSADRLQEWVRPGQTSFMAANNDLVNLRSLWIDMNPGEIPSAQIIGLAGTNAQINFYSSGGAALTGLFGFAGTNGALADAALTGDCVFRSQNKGARFAKGTATILYINENGGIEIGSMSDATATNGSLYYSTTQSKLVYKDSGGTVNNLY